MRARINENECGVWGWTRDVCSSSVPNQIFGGLASGGMSDNEIFIPLQGATNPYAH